MTQYFVNFNDEYALNDNLFTVDAARWAAISGTITPTIVTDGQRNVLSFETSVDAPLRFLPAGTPTDFELLALVRKVSTAVPNPTIAGRYTGTGTANMSFLGGNLRNNSTEGRIFRYTNGSASDVTAVHGLANHAGWVWIRFRVDGTRRRVRLWQEGDDEPVSTWLIDVNTGGPSAAGAIALTNRRTGTSISHIAVFSVGTNGDTAPTEAPATGPTITNVPNMTQGVEATITGTGFGATTGTLEYGSTIVGPWTAHAVNTWSDTEITITPNLPSGGQYYWRVTTSGAETVVGGPNTVIILVLASLNLNQSLTLEPASSVLLSASLNLNQSLTLEPASSVLSPSTIIATGGTITEITVEGVDYKVHTFTSGGTFEVTSGSGNVEYLIVAGGGGGGSRSQAGGGGGAGGMRTGTASAGVGVYTVVVGNGGAGGADTGALQGQDGGNSSALSITSTGGGGGAASTNTEASGNGHSGGSGGGGGQGSLVTGGALGGAGTAGQGYDGGDAAPLPADGTANAARRAGGGGGGAGGLGGDATANATDSIAGTAGAGVSSSIDGTSKTYASGGRGGNAADDQPAAPSANTGSGGAGSCTASFTSGRNGGSGIVVLRYVETQQSGPIITFIPTPLLVGQTNVIIEGTGFGV